LTGTEKQQHYANKIPIRQVQQISGHRNKYWLWQIDPRDGIALYTEADDQCDKLAVDRRKHCQLTGPVYYTLGVHLRGAKLIMRRFDKRRAMAKFSKPSV